MNKAGSWVRVIQLFPVLALIVSLFSILITPASVGAAEYKDLSVEDQARSYTYYRALASCMDGIKNEIKADAQYDGLRTNPANGYWYGWGDSANPDRKSDGQWSSNIASGDAKWEADVTPKSASSYGTLGCTEITTTGLNDYWGATPAELLVGLKYEWNGTDKWVFKGEGNQKSTYLKAFLSSQGVSLEYTPAVEYFVNLNTFVNKYACAAKNNGLYVSQSDSLKNRYENNNTALTAYEGETVYKALFMSDGTSTSRYAYTYAGHPDHPNPLQGSYLLYFDNYKTCDQMAQNIQDNARAYSTALLKNRCEGMGYKLATLNACMDGLAHTGNTAYCDKYNSNQEQKDACLAAVGSTPPENPGTNLGAEDDNLQPGEGASSCAIDAIGWIICPVINFLANVADASFDFLADNFLRTDVKILDTAGPTYAVWAIMRNLANVAFVIIFIFIIFSQVTGVGVSNYGVKKLLPRLAVAAILVNLSFIICQLAVDLSNILGYSLQNVFAGIESQIPGSADGVSGFATGTVFSDVAVGIVAGGLAVAALYAMLSLFLPILGAAVVALAMILFILVARQALIVILIVIAPLAFVAYLLPNTEKLFSQWRKMFTALLLLFPIIALVYGMSRLASTVLTTSFSADASSAAAGNSMWGQMIGAAVLVLPLFIVPMLLKKSLDGIPMLGQLANKWSSKANGSLGNKMKSGYNNSLVGRGRATRKAAREEFRNQKYAQRLSQGGKRGAIANVAAGGLSTLGLTKQQKAQKSAIASSARSVVANAEAKDLSNALQVLNSDMADAQVKQGDSFNKDNFLMGIAKDPKATDTQKAAAMHQLASLGRDKQVRELQSHFRSTGDTHAEENLNRAISANGGALVGKAPDLVKGGAGPAFDTVTGDQMAGFSKGTAEVHIQHLETLYKAASAPGASADDKKAFNVAMTSFNSAVADIRSNPTLQAKFGGDVGLMIHEQFANSKVAGFGAYTPSSIDATSGKIR